MSTTDSPDPIVEGAQLTYTATIANLRPETAGGVVATNVLSSHVTFVSAKASPGTCEVTGKKIECSLGMLLVGDAGMTVKVIPKKPGTIPNRTEVRLRAADTDPVASNHVHVETTTVTEAGGGGGGAPPAAAKR